MCQTIPPCKGHSTEYSRIAQQPFAVSEWCIAFLEPPASRPVHLFNILSLRFWMSGEIITLARDMSAKTGTLVVQLTQTKAVGVWQCVLLFAQVKVALMNYMDGLTMMMDPADFTNSSDTRLAVSRIITWTTEPKSVDVRKVSARAFSKLAQHLAWDGRVFTSEI